MLFQLCWIVSIVTIKLNFSRCGCVTATRWGIHPLGISEMWNGAKSEVQLMKYHNITDHCRQFWPFVGQQFSPNFPSYYFFSVVDWNTIVPLDCNRMGTSSNLSLFGHSSRLQRIWSQTTDPLHDKNVTNEIGQREALQLRISINVPSNSHQFFRVFYHILPAPNKSLFQGQSRTC